MRDMSKHQPEPSEKSEDNRRRILEAAAAIVRREGSAAASTRTVAREAGVQQATIYRVFGDKAGLLDAVAEHVLAEFVVMKAEREPHPDPLEDLRQGWDNYIAFGLENPEVFVLMSARTGSLSPASASGLGVLRRKIARLAVAGRLSTSEERAVDLIHATGVGTVLSLIQQPGEFDPASYAAARESVLNAIVGEGEGDRHSELRTHASAVRAELQTTDKLTDGEKALMGELLRRLAEK